MNLKVFSIKHLIALIIFVGGAGILLYPAISGFLNERSQTAVVEQFESKIEALSEAEKTSSLVAAQAYNESLVQNQSSLTDPFADEGAEDPSSDAVNSESPNEITFLKVGEVMASLEIPSIGVKLPIYEGVSEDVLQKGVGWMRGTSLPVGGRSTHTVLSGHRGLPSSRLFTDLDQLAIDDEFYLRNSGEILAYRVISRQVIEPQDTSALGIVDGKDLATLLTCHPYMVNSQRLLVTGERVPYIGQLDQMPDDAGILDAWMSPAEKDLGIALSIVGACALLGLVLIVAARRKSKKKGESDETN